MNPEQILPILDKIEFFSDLTEEEKRAVSNLKNDIKYFRPNEKIIKQGEVDCSLYILLKGSVTVTRDEKPYLVLNKLKPGAVFGEMSALAKKERSTTVIAQGEAVVLQLDGEYFEKIGATLQNKFKDKFIDILIKRLEEMNQTILKMAR